LTNEPRITDHDDVLAAARADASREGARMVKMTVLDLWGMIRRAPSLSSAERERLGFGLRPE
jgi:hypothetical protein